MTTTVQAIVVDCADAARSAAFWAAALGRTVDGDATEEFASIGIDGQPGELTWMFTKVPEPKSGKNRIHLDLCSSSPSADIDRLVALGATRVNDFDEDGIQWTTLTDPEGNEFDLVTQEPN